MIIRYGRWTEAWSGYAGFLERFAARPNVKRVLEIGGGANPAMSREFVRDHGLEYTLLDVSADELAKTPDGYEAIRADITSPDPVNLGTYDLVFSKMVAEHVSSGRAFHRNVLRLLSERGIAFHFFPTLYALPFVMNRALPETLATFVLTRLQEGRDACGRRAKFPAYYSWCRGPLARQIRRLRRMGYSVEEYVGFFGHGYYGKLKGLQTMHEYMAGLLLRYPVPWLTSYAYLVLTRRNDRSA